MPMVSKRLISIVTPVCNEQENVRAFYAAVCEAVRPEADKYDFEFVFTDNHSEDRTFELLSELAAADVRVRALRFSRNFGYQRSIHAGLMNTLGDAAIQLDCDLQDPPTMIREFLRKWESGYVVVYGIRRSRQEPLTLRLSRRAFYWLANAISQDELPRDAGDFRLVDRAIIEELRQIQDRDIYIRGRIAQMGFRQIGLPYDRAPRIRGRSKFRFKQNASLALDAITGHSIWPLRAATYFGLLLTVGTVMAALAYLIAYLTTDKAWPPGFATLLLLSLANLGILSMFLGIIGEYVGRIFEQIKSPSRIIVESRIEPRSIDRLASGLTEPGQVEEERRPG